MKTDLIKACLYVVLAPLFLANHAMGALIIWTGPTTVNTSDVSQVVNTGTLMVAEFMHTTSTDTLDINGVHFVDWKVAPNITNPAGLSNASFLSPTGAYQTLLSAGYYHLDSSGNVPIIFTGLNPGQSYLVQVWTPYWDSATFSTRVSSTAPVPPSAHAADESGTMALGFGGTLPQFVTGTFTADASTQNLYFFGDGTVGLLGALQLRAVPEPTTTGLLFLGTLALIVRRCFRQCELVL